VEYQDFIERLTQPDMRRIVANHNDSYYFVKAERSFHRAIDLLADALAEQIIAQARIDVAVNLGRCPNGIDRDRERGLSDRT